MEFAFFIGCTAPVRALNYEMSTRKVAEVFHIKLKNIDDFSCCGYPIESVDSETSMLFAARNICEAEERELDIATLCSACTAILTKTNKLLKKNEKIRKKINELLEPVGKEFKGKIKIRHFVRILYEDIGIENIKKHIKRDLSTLKIAPHYGCHYIKPVDIYENFDDHEFPFTINELIEATSAKSINYEDLKQCCGGGILGIDENTSLKMSRIKLEHIKSVGADAMTLICPFCSIMYDSNQKKIEKKFDVKFRIPVLYYTQLLGLALGLSPKELGFQMNRVKTKDFLEKIGL